VVAHVRPPKVVDLCCGRGRKRWEVREEGEKAPVREKGRRRWEVREEGEESSGYAKKGAA